MKKHLRSTERKLTLHRETVRRLEEPVLEAARGGGVSLGATGPCFTCPLCVITFEDC
jgi:hypothetical protein